MPTLSLTMIVKNEETTIERVLGCAKTFCDEIIVVDTGSTDRTVELAEQMGAKVFPFEWVDDFAAARNYSLAQCTGDWIIWLDADDVISHEAQQHMLTLKSQILNDSLDVVHLPYNYIFSPTNPKVCTLQIMRERLFRRVIGPRWKFPIHEHIEMKDEWRCLTVQDLHIDHRPADNSQPLRLSRNIAILKKTAKTESPHPRMLYYYGLACLELKQPEEAIQVFAQYFQQSENQPKWEIYDAYLALAIHYKEIKNFAQAQHHCLQAIQLDNQRARALNQMGIMLYLQNQWVEAIPYLTAASQLKKPIGNYGYENNDDYTWLPYHYLSLCHEKTGRYAEAVQLAVQSLPGHPHQELVKQHLHELLELL